MNEPPEPKLDDVLRRMLAMKPKPKAMPLKPSKSKSSKAKVTQAP